MSGVIVLLLAAVASVPIMLIVLLARSSSLKEKVDRLAETQDRMRDTLRWIHAAVEKAPTTAKTEPAAEPARPEPAPAREAPAAPAEQRMPPPSTATMPVASVPAAPVPPPLQHAKESPPPPKAPEMATRAFESAKDVLRKIWSWLLVGEEFRPRSVSMEYAVASTWLMRLGIVATVACVAFFLKWSIERNLITEWMRVGISVASGVAMLLAGLRLLGRQYRIIGHGLVGGGFAALYFSMYAAGMWYHLLNVPTAFVLMALITAAAGVLAVRTDTMLVALFGIIGGYCTPILLSTGVPQFAVLYSYLLLLGLGVLGIAHFKQWRLLNYLAFVFTYTLVLGSLEHYSRRLFPLTISFLSAFFVLHSWIVLYHNIIRRNRSTALEIMHLLANASVYSLTGYFLIRNAFPGPYPAFLTMSLAAFYVGHVYVFLRRGLTDRVLLVALVAMAGLYAALTLPIIMEKESLTICMALLGFMYLWLAMKMNSNLLRNIAYVIYLCVFGRLLVFDTPAGFTLDSTPSMAAAHYWHAMIERLWTFGISLASILGAFLVQRRQFSRFEKMTVSRENDTGEIVPAPAASHALYWFGVLFLFLFLQLESNLALGYLPEFRLTGLTMLWCIMAGYFLWRYVASGRKEMLVALCFFAAVGVAKIIFVDLESWRLGTRWLYGCEYSGLYVGARLADFAAVLLMMFTAWKLLRPRGNRTASSVFGYGGLAVMFLYLTLEVNSGLHSLLPASRLGGISTFWALYAIGLLAGGIWRNLRPLRYAGLLLFTIVTAKVFLVDLENVQGIYRVAMFLCVGIFLLLGSFAYVRATRKFVSLPPAGDGQEVQQ